MKTCFRQLLIAPHSCRCAGEDVKRNIPYADPDTSAQGSILSPAFFLSFFFEAKNLPWSSGSRRRLADGDKSSVQIKPQAYVGQRVVFVSNRLSDPAERTMGT